MNRNLNPESFDCGGKMIRVVENHQYALLVWYDYSKKIGKSCELVSIDFHPDTNPPFWLYAYQKAIANNPEKEEELTAYYQEQILKKIDPQRKETLEVVMKEMRNDEQINTALQLGVISDYHMINCMEAHQYIKGHHYLVPESHFGSLDDEMFELIGFNDDGIKTLVLDIDLDYFLKEDLLIQENQKIIRNLIKKADLITIARSPRYFEYLKKESFSIDDCQKMVIDFVRKSIKLNR